jgi:hypothetical protein
MSEIGKLLIYAGAVLLLLEVVFVLASKIPWPGRLPGDIYIQRRNMTFYFPLATSLILSMLLSLIFYLLSRR